MVEERMHAIWKQVNSFNSSDLIRVFYTLLEVLPFDTFNDIDVLIGINQHTQSASENVHGIRKHVKHNFVQKDYNFLQI